MERRSASARGAANGVEVQQRVHEDSGRILVGSDQTLTPSRVHCDKRPSSSVALSPRPGRHRGWVLAPAASERSPRCTPNSRPQSANGNWGARGSQLPNWANSEVVVRSPRSRQTWDWSADPAPRRSTGQCSPPPSWSSFSRAACWRCMCAHAASPIRRNGGDHSGIGSTASTFRATAALGS